MYKIPRCLSCRDKAHYVSRTKNKYANALPYKRLMGMCRWIRSHFHDWID